MAELKAALQTIHADRDWWWKIALGGALWLTVIGWPIVEGFQIESLENSQRGFPTPLPRWTRFGDKIVVGLFALLIDFFYFVFPLMLAGMLSFCGLLATSLSATGGITGSVTVIALGITGLYLLAVWLLGASPIGKQRYASEGDMERTLSARLILELVREPERHLYLLARLRSLPPYILAGLLLIAAVWLAKISFLLTLAAAWLGLSVLLYARLITIQLYLRATRTAQRIRFDLLYQENET
ncbi:MAG TPA: DUF4013 domain-containing protein [Herpetosiphonaceae bacterium]|nr:DUF4013 domain-containing protein [Herpetosiphonaceae bacterium]